MKWQHFFRRSRPKSEASNSIVRPTRGQTMLKWVPAICAVLTILIAVVLLPRQYEKLGLEIKKLKLEVEHTSTAVGAVEKTTDELKSQIRTLLKVSRADRRPAIDGKLDEDSWLRTEPLTFAFHPPSNGSTTATVKLLWDDEYLYAAFDVNDTQVEGSTATPWDGDSVSVIIVNGGQIREYRHSLLNDRAGNGQSAYQLKGKTTFNDSKDRDEGFIIEMRIPWATTPVAGKIIAADFLSVDHDENPGGRFGDPNTVFSKISWDGDTDVRTANRKIQLLVR